MTLVDEAPAEADVPAEPPKASWGDAPVPAIPTFVCFWFVTPDGGRFSDLDLTGKEALALEKRIGCPWNEMRPLQVLEHRMVALELFIARTDPEHARQRVGAMTMRELQDAVEAEFGSRQDDLPEGFEDGIPKAVPAEP